MSGRNRIERELLAGVSALVLTLAANASSAGPPAKSPPKGCWGRVSAVGCCIGERLIYCDEAGKPRQLDCSGKPRCGWRATGRYDCNTAGAADPAGRYARFCSLPDAGLPFDLGAGRGADSGCGKISEEGCCFGQELRFCEQGKLRRLSCKSNLYCGWRGVAQAYNCGTEGKGDPRGKHPRSCPGAPDAGPQRFPDRGVAPAGPTKSSGGCGGCGCEIARGASGAASASAQLMLLLAAALLLSRCSAGGCRSRSRPRPRRRPPA